MRMRFPASCLLVVLGLSLCALAAIASPARLEIALLGQHDGRLSWGPALFRGLLAWHGVFFLAWGGSCLLANGRRTLSGQPSEDREAYRVPKSHALTLALIATLLLALVLRFWKLGSCLWYDEIATFTEFLRLPFRAIVTTFPSQNQHMFYSVLGHACFVLFGESVVAARLPALLFGMGSLLALFLYGRRTNGTREALLATLLMTVSYHHIWFSQNARGYTGVLFFTIMATWCFFEATARGKTRWWLWYVVSLTLGLWTHLTMLFVVASHGLVYLTSFFMSPARRATSPFGADDTQARWKALLAWVMAATLTLQLYALSLPEFLASALHETSVPSDWTHPGWIVEEAVRRLGDIGATGVIVLVGFSVLMIGLVSLARRDWRVAILMILPAVLGGVAMIALGHNLWPRFFFFCMGFFILLAVRGATVVGYVIAGKLVQAERRTRVAEQLGTAFTLVVIFASAVTVRRCYAFPKQDYLGAREYVEQERLPGDGVVAVGLAGDAYHAYYAPHWLLANSADELAKMSKHYRRLWIVYTLTVQLEAWHPDLFAVIKTHCHDPQVFRGTLGGGDVVVCQLGKGWMSQ